MMPLICLSSLDFLGCEWFGEGGLEVCIYMQLMLVWCH
jgi:hypothetical protein